MKIYNETENGGFSIGGKYIPKSDGNTDYLKMLDEVESGESEILPYVPEKPTQEQVALGILSAEGITQNTVTLALYLNATQSDPTLLNRVDTTVKSAVAKSGASYESVTTALTGA